MRAFVASESVRLGSARLFAHERPLYRSLAGGVVLALALGAAVAGSSLVLHPSAVTNMLILMVAVVGMQVFIGNSGILSFGHVAFLGLGAYASALLTTEEGVKQTLTGLPTFLVEMTLPFPVAGLVAVAFVGAVAAAFGAVIVRLSPYGAAIATLALLVIVQSVLFGATGITRGAQTFYGVPPETTLTIAFVVALAALVIARVFKESIVGLRLRAAREDELAARSFGADIARLRLKAWVLGAMIAGAAGVLYAHFLTAFSPSEFFLPLTLTLLIMLVVGGSATVLGSVIGTVLVTLIIELLRDAESGFALGPLEIGSFFGLTQIVLALVMLLVLYFRHGGLSPRRELDEVLVALAERGGAAT